jgi:hypothetical protein
MTPRGYSQMAIDTWPKTGIFNRPREPNRGDLLVGHFPKEATRPWVVLPRCRPVGGSVGPVDQRLGNTTEPEGIGDNHDHPSPQESRMPLPACKASAHGMFL